MLGVFLLFLAGSVDSLNIANHAISTNIEMRKGLNLREAAFIPHSGRLINRVNDRYDRYVRSTSCRHVPNRPFTYRPAFPTRSTVRGGADESNMTPKPRSKASANIFRYVAITIMMLALPRFVLAATAGSTSSLVASHDTWSLWLVLLTCATAGLVAERTKLGAALSSPLVTMLLTLSLCNLGVIPFDAPLYSSVNHFLVPMAVPLLLFGADLRRCPRPPFLPVTPFCCFISRRSICSIRPS